MQPADNIPTNRTTINPTPSRDNTQGIKNQDSHSPRASQIVSREPFYVSSHEKEVLHKIIHAKSNPFRTTKQDLLLSGSQIHLATLALFERSCICFPQILSFLDQSLKNDLSLTDMQSLKNSLSLKNILTLRLISKTICELVSMHCFLKEKASIAFNYLEPWTITGASIKEKFFFAKQENVQICIISSMRDLLSLSSTLDFVKENEPTICLEIQNIEELNRLQLWLSTSPKSKFLKKIVKLDLKKFPINNTNIDKIYSLLDFQQLVFLPALSTIVFGDINTHFTMPGIKK